MQHPLSEKQLVDIIDKAITNFEGPSDRLAGAIGYLMIGRKVGWRVMFFMHSQGTVRKYEAILGIKSREVMPQLGPKAKKAVAYQAIQKVSNFWKAVKGEVAGIKSNELVK